MFFVSASAAGREYCEGAFVTSSVVCLSHWFMVTLSLLTQSSGLLVVLFLYKQLATLLVESTAGFSFPWSRYHGLKYFLKELIMEDLEQSKIQSSEKTDAVLQQKEDYLWIH